MIAIGETSPYFEGQEITRDQSSAFVTLASYHEEVTGGGHAVHCDEILLVGIVSSLIMCILPKFMRISHCSAAGVVSHVLFVGISTSGTTYCCRFTLVWELSFLMVWLLTWYCAQKPQSWHFNLFLEGADAAKFEYERRLSLMPGPLQACYESDFFRNKCEEAIDEVTRSSAHTVTVDEFGAAGRQVTLDPDFLTRPTMSAVVRAFPHVVLSRSKAIMVLKWACALSLESNGSQMPCYYHYNVLQLPLNSDLGEVRQRYDVLCERWSSKGTEEQIKTSLNFLECSFQAVSQDILTRKSSLKVPR